jgi:hypothetical protein
MGQVETISERIVTRMLASRFEEIEEIEIDDIDSGHTCGLL